ncbi:hypothetical protein GCM10007887_35710 [Methylobacterium haplocladii]|uniref:Uncharacterized protein n=1 Tax=Methylobacterium haplocladii TaxID=1176176 RepID=A0A512IPE6_9HYPH|nr:hypothetical protein MHA02_19380 [Methylobacterium haplocladii]GLS60882.1 hypothetical protein GCM10007887_35710 [Methylobacterium haplocladii]
MRQGFEARQAEEPAGSLDGVDQAEDVSQDRLVVGILLEFHELGIDGIEMLGALGEELAKQIVHRPVLGLRAGICRAKRTVTELG